MTRECPYHEYQARNPFRSPSWRWNRAEDLVRRGCYYSRKRDDPPTGEAVYYLRTRRRGEHDRPSSRWLERYSDLHTAHGLFEENGLRRTELESRVLARQNPAEIANAMSLCPGVVEKYESVFFDLDGRLDARAYIIHEVIKLPPAGPPPLTALMKTYAYSCGPATVGAWLDYFLHQDEQHNLATAEGRRRAWIELDIAIRCLPDDKETEARLLKVADLIFDWSSKPIEIRAAAQVFAQETAEIIKSRAAEGFQEPLAPPPHTSFRVRENVQTRLRTKITEAA